MLLKKPKFNLLVSITNNIAMEIMGQCQGSVMLMGMKEAKKFSNHSKTSKAFSANQTTNVPKPKGKMTRGVESRTTKNKSAKTGMAIKLEKSPTTGNDPKIVSTIPAVTIQRSALEVSSEILLEKIPVHPIVKADMTDNFQPTSHTNQGLHKSKQTAARLTA